MHTNKKVMLIVFVMLSLLSLATVINVWINFTDFGKKTTIDKAHSIAESVRDGLTAHMVLGAMDKRELYLNNMIKHQNVKMLRVIRSKKIVAEYGDGTLDPYKYDDVEKSVLKNGKSITKMVETDRDSYLRITIPYIATKYSNPNCLTCHNNVKEGDVLGAISLELDIQEVKSKSFETIVKIVFISVLFLVLAYFIARYYIKPYTKLFDDLEEGISKAYNGDFSHHVTTNLSHDSAKVAKRLNDLSEIFRFKKTIELDADKETIYQRVAHILESNFGLKYFIIFENNIQIKKREVVHRSAKATFVDIKSLENSPHVCRAFRTNLGVCSTDFHKICDLCYREDKESVCLPFNISDEFSLTLLVYVDSEAEVNRVREAIPIISNYFELTVPVLQTKLLMNKLHEKSLRDGMTNLYNRRYLDSYLDKTAKNSDKFYIMMIDIDFFKQVNDAYGHDVGDQVIKALSNVLKYNVAHPNIAVRYGGEEFLVLSYHDSHEEVVELADTIREEFSKHTFKSNHETFSKTLSIGVAGYPRDSSSAWETLKHADVALYYAKNHGRDQTILFEKEMYEEDMI
jgi:diguanylate cyclase (GGDEF)-like protein